MNNAPNFSTDFWWLPNNPNIKDLLIGIGHHREIADNDGFLPQSCWYRSLNIGWNLLHKCQHHPIDLLDLWRSACKNTNVYRTLKVFDRNRQTILLGPFLVDIDNEKDVDDTQNIAKQVFEYLAGQHNVPLNDLLIFFSGHKGFNIEVRPQALGIYGSIPDQIRLSSDLLDKIISFARNTDGVIDSTTNVVSNQGTLIDRIYGDRFGYKLMHPYVRLHGSINKWNGDDGKAIARRKIEVTYEQLCEKSTNEISSRSEKATPQL